MTGATEQPKTARNFSLFEGDFVNRAFGVIGLGQQKVRHVAGRCLVLIVLTWLPTAVLAAIGGNYSLDVNPANFFADYAAYAQFLLGLPLFVIAEAIVSRATRRAGIEFATSGVVRAKDLPALQALNARIERFRTSWWSDVICLAIGGGLSAAIILTELKHPPADPSLYTWHTELKNGVWTLTLAGWWEFCAALPILNYWWLRQIWKIMLWTGYLYRTSRFRLDLVPTHPDRTAGIGFISDVQAQFAWLILAYGVSNVAATVGYKIAVEHAEIWLPPVWGPVAGFVVIAPSLFLFPLFMFTRQLARTKHHALQRYRRRVVEHVRLFEDNVMARRSQEQLSLPSAIDLSVMDQVSKQFERVEHMRVVPFDFRSMAQLFAFTLGSVSTIFPALHIEGPATKFLEALVKLFEFFGSGH